MPALALDVAYSYKLRVSNLAAVEGRGGREAGGTSIPSGTALENVREVVEAAVEELERHKARASNPTGRPKTKREARRRKGQPESPSTPGAAPSTTL